MGISFGQYLKNARMKKARQLLETSFQSIKAITIECGYNDPAHFEREFKKAYNLTPLQYRTEHLASFLLGQSKKQKEPDSLANSIFLQPFLLGSRRAEEYISSRSLL